MDIKKILKQAEELAVYANKVERERDEAIAKLAAMESQSTHWIDCKERLPKKSDADIAGNVTCRWSNGEIIAIPWADVEPGDDEWLCMTAKPVPSHSQQSAHISEEILKKAYWDFDARVNGLPPYSVPYGQPEHAFVVSVIAALHDRCPSHESEQGGLV